MVCDMSVDGVSVDVVILAETAIKFQCSAFGRWLGLRGVFVLF